MKTLSRETRIDRNKAKREFFVNMASAIGCSVCIFCKYSECEDLGCCKGFMACNHPIERLCEIREEGLGQGNDCWGFHSNHPPGTITEIVSAILTNNINPWTFVIYSKNAVTVYGYEYESGKGVKVRIGHDGKPGPKEKYDPQKDPCDQKCGSKYWHCAHPCGEGRGYYWNTV